MGNKKIIDKNYGSIPHLSTSKMTQQADKKIGIGQEKILTQKARDWKDLIIVTEKLDGSNVGIVERDGEIIPITRKGYHADTSPFKQHHYFSKWVRKYRIFLEKFFKVFPGFRLCGEWLAMVHGTKYDITDRLPFVLFDIFDPKNKRIQYIDFIRICSMFNFISVPLLHIGQPISIKNAVKLLGCGNYKAEKPEGVVYRCEREGRVDFLAKWVRHDKEDGKYMQQEIYNKGFEIGS